MQVRRMFYNIPKCSSIVIFKTDNLRTKSLLLNDDLITIGNWVGCFSPDIIRFTKSEFDQWFKIGTFF